MGTMVPTIMKVDVTLNKILFLKFTIAKHSDLAFDKCYQSFYVLITITLHAIWEGHKMLQKKTVKALVSHILKMFTFC